MAFSRKHEFAKHESSKRRPISAVYHEQEMLTESSVPRNETFPLQTQALNIALSSAQVKACLTMGSLSDSNHLNDGDFCEFTGNDLMTQSLVFLPSFGRRHHPELVPVLPRERDIFSSSIRISPETSKHEVKSGPKRAISMTRLDQLSKPRQRYLEETLKARNSGNSALNSNENCMVRSMYNLTTKTSSSSGLQTSARKGMSTSMSQLSCRKASVKSCANAATPQPLAPQPFSPFNQRTRKLSKSMVHLNAKPPQPMRDTRTSIIRTVTQVTLNVSDPKERPLMTSPTRPVSSLSGTTDNSTVSSVKMRPRVARKPRPVSIAGCAAEKKAESAPADVKAAEKKTVAPRTPQRPNRARSAGSTTRRPLNDVDKDAKTNSQKPAPPRKPAHVKAAAAARKSAKQGDQKQETLQPKSPDKPLAVKPPKIPNGIKSPQHEAEDRKPKPKVPDESSAIVIESAPDIENEMIDVAKDSNEENIESAAAENRPAVECSNDNTASVKKEITEEEYKKLMMEKRKLAREQAEREAEALRLKEEQERREEEERQRKIEEAQRLFEEEQMRLAEEYRKLEEERLRKAMEEQKLKDEEEKKYRNEEESQRLEREEQEMKAREEAERARLELEERLRNDEEERIARKKRVEAIMTRTRKTPGKSSPPCDNNITNSIQTQSY